MGGKQGLNGERGVRGFQEPLEGLGIGCFEDFSIFFVTMLLLNKHPLTKRISPLCDHLSYLP